jgi:hypothetical protein
VKVNWGASKALIKPVNTAAITSNNVSISTKPISRGDILKQT